MNRRAFVVFVIGVSLLGLGLNLSGAVVFVSRLGVFRSRLPARPPEDLTQKRQEMAEAFSRVAEELDEAEERAIRELFDGLSRALKRQDPVAVVSYFNADRLVAELERLPDWPGLGFGQRRPFLRALESGLATSLVQNPFLRWDRIRVQRFYPAADRPEALVYVRHFDDEEMISMKLRWWLVNDGHRWRIYDFEDLDVGNRASTTMGTVMASLVGSRRPPVWVMTFQQNFQQAIQAIADGDVEQAERHLIALQVNGLPAVIESLRLVLLASLRLQQCQAEESLELIDRAEALNADLPLAHFLRAAACNQLERFEEAIRHGRQHLELLGDDADTYELIGDALLHLGRTDEAAEAYRKALDDAPNSPELLHALGYVLPERQMQEVAQRFARLAQPAEHFEAFASRFVFAQDREALGILLTVYAVIAPDDPTLTLYRALASILDGEIADAVTQFREAVDCAPQELKADFQSEFLSSMIRADKMMEGYQAAPDAVQAFRYLATWYLDEEDGVDRVRILIAAHRGRQPDDPWLDFYEGELYLRDKDYEAAERSFAAGMVRVTDDDDREIFRYTRVHARVEAGAGLSAYAEIGPRKATFDQLVWRYSVPDQVEQLGELIAAHRQHESNDIDLLLWQAEYHWLRKEYGKAVELLIQFRALAQEEHFGWRITDRLVRCYLRLQRLADAQRELDMHVEKVRFQPLLTAAVAAVSGDVERTAQALAACTDLGYDAEDFYRDEDLGSALRGERFKALREKYPEPPAGQGRGGIIY